VLICASYPEPGVLLARHGATTPVARVERELLVLP
jgi:hypothetical protein